MRVWIVFGTVSNGIEIFGVYTSKQRAEEAKAVLDENDDYFSIYGADYIEVDKHYKDGWSYQRWIDNKNDGIEL